MINVGFILSNPDFSQSITLQRQTGSYIDGRWTPSTPTTITLTGAITIPSETDMEQMPEGDRQKGLICVYSTQPLELTNPSGTADQVYWNRDGNWYRVSRLFPFGDYGYYKAICVRMVTT